MSNIAIKAENISKYYRLGQINNGTLFQDIQTWLALKRGKEDPHSRIGEDKYHNNKDGFWALKDLDFEIQQGDRVGIIGKNGAGKSTLLKVISEITNPTTGTIRIKGRIASLLEVGTGFHPEMTGRENIYLNGSILGMKKHEIDRKLDEIIDFSEIEQHIDTPVKRYSSGMYVRLAFAVAAHLDSEILIADEVLAVGDATFQKKALGKMNDLSTGQGRTVLFVSHQMNAVKSLCNKGIVLEKGRIIRYDDDINNSVSYYLGTNDFGNNLVTTSWKNDGSFYNENFCPQKLFIEDENGNVINQILDYKKSYTLKLKVTIDNPDSNVDFWIETYKGTEPIASFPMPVDIKYTKGENVYQWIIPASSLPPNSYVFSVGSSLKNTKWILEPSQFLIYLVTLISNNNKSIFTINNSKTALI